MASNPDPGMEGLCAIVHDETDGSTAIRHLRDLSPEESALSRTDELLLRWLSVRNPIRPLSLALDEFHAAVSAWEDRAAAVNWPEPGYEMEVQRHFRAWLTEFRIFDEHTAEEIRRQLGRSHQSVERFKESLSLEFDANFGYRLTCSLRNVALHSGGVIDHFVSQPEAKAGQPRVKTRLELNSAKLATNKRMRQKTADELRGLSFNLDPEKVAGLATTSCVRVWGRLLRSIAPEAQDAVDRTFELHGEVQAHAAGALCAIVKNPNLGGPLPKLHLVMRFVHTEMADEVRGSLSAIGQSDLDSIDEYQGADLACDL